MAAGRSISGTLTRCVSISAAWDLQHNIPVLETLQYEVQQWCHAGETDMQAVGRNCRDTCALILMYCVRELLHLHLSGRGDRMCAECEPCLEKRMLESGRGTSPARAAAPRRSVAITAGWLRQDRHARSSGDSAAAGKAESGARSGISTALCKQSLCKGYHSKTLEQVSLATEEACWEVHLPACKTMLHQLSIT